MRTDGPTRGHGAPGIALGTTILFALVLLVAGHGILVFTRTQQWITTTDGVRWKEDEARQAALRTLVAELDSLPGAGFAEMPWARVGVRALSSELRLLSADPDPAAPGTGWAALIASPMPVPRVRARSGAVRVGGAVFETGSVAGAASDDACPAGLSGLVLNRIGPLPDSVPVPRLGVLSFEDLLDAFPRLTSDRLELPETGARDCGEPNGFGDPTRPSSCSGVWGAGARLGDLTLAGRGQGVLAVSGDLILEADASFRGWVWVGGSLRLESGAELRGLGDVGERFIVDPGARFYPDACAGALALESGRHAFRPKPVGPGIWPLFRP